MALGGEVGGRAFVEFHSLEMGEDLEDWKGLMSWKSAPSSYTAPHK